MAGGSQIIINKDGITVITLGKFEVKAADHTFLGGASIPTPNIHLPQLGIEPYVGKYLLFKSDGSPFVGHEYKIMDKHGNILDQGITTEFGETALIQTEHAEKITYDIKELKQEEYLDDSWEENFEKCFSELEAFLDDTSLSDPLSDSEEDNT